ncbi:MAG: hypothetical protein K2L99_05050 [Muribaculaceae bacterium]|nr:hypothetical protein [Muribaculaceae bacterium]
MKYLRLILMLIASCCCTAALAQDGLAINRLFDSRAGDDKGSQTYISGGQLRKMKLELYRSITLENPQPETVAEIERLVKRDGAHAAEREVQLRGGKLYYGLYRLTPQGGLNRYVLYLNSALDGSGKLILVYIEGKADIDQLKKLLKK